MNNWQLGLLAWYALGVLLNIGMIGKERKPMTPGVAVFYVAIYALLAYAVFRA